MPTPCKPFSVLSGEKKSHRTKAELNIRKQAEEATLTGEKIKELPEVKENRKAHETFKRVNKLLTNIQKNDAIYEQIINRYCMLVAECEDFYIQREQLNRDLEELTENKDSYEDMQSYFEMKVTIQKNLIALDKQLQTKRKMLLDIEKENIMTIASALRSIPKKQENKSSELVKILGGSG